MLKTIKPKDHFLLVANEHLISSKKEEYLERKKNLLRMGVKKQGKLIGYIVKKPNRTITYNLKFFLHSDHKPAYFETYYACGEYYREYDWYLFDKEFASAK